MNTNKIASLYNQIKNADRIVAVDNREVLEAAFADIEGNIENQVIYLGWYDEVGNEYRVVITEEGLNNSTVLENGCVNLVDNEGEELLIRLYSYTPIDVNQNW